MLKQTIFVALCAASLTACSTSLLTNTTTGDLNVHVVTADSPRGYSTLNTNKKLGDILAEVTFALSGSSMPSGITKKLVKSDWTNADGSFKSIAETTFGDLLVGRVTVTVSGVATDGKRVLEGSQQVDVAPNEVTSATVIAQWITGNIKLGIDPNSVVMQPK